jgi:O-antigen/teichoic acid export membrane protein
VSNRSGAGTPPASGPLEERGRGPGSISEPEGVVSSSLASGGRLLAFRAVQFAFLFLLSLLVTRALGPEGRGQYALALNLATVVWVVSHFSVEHSIARMMARREASVTELSGLASFFALSLGLLGAAIALAIGLPARGSLLGDASAATVALAAATIPFTLIAQLATALLLRLGDLRPYGWTIAAGAGMQLALVVALEAGLGLSPALAMLAALATMAAVAVALAAALARRVGARALAPLPERWLVGAALRIGIRLQPASVALWLNLKVDLLLVGLLVSTDEAGLYSLSANLAEMVFLGVSTIALAALEAQTKAHDDLAVEYTVEFIGQNLWVAALLGTLAAALAYPFVVVLYGSAWQGSVLPFVLLMPAVVGLAVEGPARDLLIRIAPPLVVSAAAAAGLGANVVLNFLLIPSLGIAGASVASVASYWLAGGLMLFLLSRYGDVSMKSSLRKPHRDDVLPTLLRRVGRRRAA